MHRKNPGFTIVELLIVIVVIAILAAISIVAYTGIQNTANDAAVQSDMRTIGGLMEQYNVTEGTYPVAATKTELFKKFTSMNGSPTFSSYATETNFLYITNPTGSEFAPVGRSKSGEDYYYSSRTQGVSTYDVRDNFGSDGVRITREYLLDIPRETTPPDGEFFWGHGASGWDGRLQ